MRRAIQAPDDREILQVDLDKLLQRRISKGHSNWHLQIGLYDLGLVCRWRCIICGAPLRSVKSECNLGIVVTMPLKTHERTGGVWFSSRNMLEISNSLSAVCLLLPLSFSIPSWSRAAPLFPCRLTEMDINESPQRHVTRRVVGLRAIDYEVPPPVVQPSRDPQRFHPPAEGSQWCNRAWTSC